MDRRRVLRVGGILTLATTASLVALMATSPGFASHHYETAIAKEYPQLDLTDLYVFESDRKGHTAIVFKFNPTAKSQDWAAAFPTNGYLSVHFGVDKTMSAGLTLSFTFKDGKIALHRVDKAAPALGELGAMLGAVDLNKESAISGMRVWTGVGPDPFPGNGKGLAIYRDAAEKGVFRQDAFKEGVDNFGAFDAAMISIDVPNAILPKKLYYYGSSVVKAGDAWRRVNRIGWVLMPHIFLLGDDYMKIIDGAPADDPANVLKVAATLEKWVSVAGNVDDPKAYSLDMAKKLLPDVVPYVPGTPAFYSPNIDQVNGRRVNDDAMNTAVSWMTGGAITDDNCYVKPERVRAYFPFVVGTSAQ